MKKSDFEPRQAVSPLALSLAQGASAVGIGSRKFAQEIAAGKIPSVKIGKRRLVTPEALSKYIEEHTVRAHDASETARRILARD
jgi:excisionase family DNA binding protein